VGVVKNRFYILGEFFGSAGTHVVLTPGNFREEGGFKEKSDKAKWYSGPVPQEYVLNEGDLIVAMTEQAEGLLGSSALIPQSGIYLHNQRLGLVQIRDRTLTDQRFLYYLFNSKSVRQQIRGSASGTKIRHTAPSRIADVKVNVPPFSVQQRIAGILAAYDDLIDNNQRRIRVVKEIARTIFMDADAAIGSWTVEPIRNFYEGLFDGPHATPAPSASGPVFLGIKNVTERGELDLSQVRHIAEQDFSRWTQRVQPRFGDIVFSYEASLHRYAIINQDFRGCLGRRLALIRPDKSRISPFVLLHCLLSNAWRREVQSKIISGATVDRIPLITFPSFSIRVPKPELMERIGAAIQSCEELAENCRHRNDLLRSTRDLLLPRLLSGQINLAQAEAAA
jgi:type I restriction enzyme S subunit